MERSKDPTYSFCNMRLYLPEPNLLYDIGYITSFVATPDCNDDDKGMSHHDKGQLGCHDYGVNCIYITTVEK
eukprot:scaffold89536_cov46-Cyclotella_meneghiniana.AAC.1